MSRVRALLVNRAKTRKEGSALRASSGEGDGLEWLLPSREEGSEDAALD